MPSITIPAVLPGPGPGEERLPTLAETALIQWLFEVEEEGYGPTTRAIVRRLQAQNGVPVDPQVMIGPRTWALILGIYHERRQLLTPAEWTLPAAPYRLDGGSSSDRFLATQIEAINRQVPLSARYFARNQIIVGLKRKGERPAREVELPSLADPDVQAAVDQLWWRQEKVDLLWERALQRGVDPRLLLAVLFQEGTGSFNTNGAIPTQYWVGDRYVEGGSGPQPDFERDLHDAFDEHIMAKVCAFGHYAAPFREAVRRAGIGDGNLFQYVNYNVPWVTSRGWTAAPGCYATHTAWWRGLQYFFDGLLYPGATADYSRYLETSPLPMPTADSPPPVRFRVTFGGTGPTEESTGLPWVEAAVL